ncbi:hypothetical protein BYT27DRAFT_7193582 [Phlegmacium glaucopus]|nr:hypothetical protein BYT27DRAFT_7193582 [Phlegmacium glaucopus]
MHCPLSSPTPELLDDLSDFDFYGFLTTWHSSEIVMKHVSYVFDWLKEHSHKNPSGKNLYSHHLCSWDEYLRSQVGLLRTCSKPAQLMVTAVMLPKFFQYCPIILEILPIDLDREASEIFRNAYLPLLFPFHWDEKEEYLPKYHIMLSNFLGDPLHSKEFYIDDSKYATLAAAFANYLFGSSMHRAHSRYQISEQGLACVFSCLPDCLHKASPSKSLALLLQNHELPSVFQDNLFEGHRATVAAIEAYILRCNVSEVPANNFIIDHSDEIDEPECMVHLVPKDGPKASHSNPTIEVGNSSIKQSETEQESNSSCNVM